MQLLVTKGLDGNPKVISDCFDEMLIHQVMQSLNWQEFNSVTVKQNEENWIDVSGNLASDGLSIVLAENGVIRVSENPPNSISDLIIMLQSYFAGNFRTKCLSVGYLNELDTKSTEFKAWKVQYEARRKIGKRNYLKSVVIAFLILFFLLMLGYLLLNDELKFVGHTTEIGVAVVTNIEWNVVGAGKAIQIVTYQYEYKNKRYNGFFFGNKFTGKHQVSDRIKIKFSVSDPAISKRIATLKQNDSKHYDSDRQRGVR